MPVHRVHADDLEAKVAELEKTDRIVSVVASGDGAFVVLTEPRRGRAPGSKETR